MWSVARPILQIPAAAMAAMATTTGEGMALAGEIEQHLAASSAPAADVHGDFEHLVAQHEARIRRLAHRLLGWRDEEVNDIVQDVFLAALNHLDRFRGEASVATWLTRVTINACRTRQRRRWLTLKWLRTARPPHFSEAGSDQGAVDNETSHRVRSAIQELSAADREVIVLFHLEELPAAQIAELLCVKVNTIQVRLHRARQRLGAKLKDLMGQ